MPTRFHLQFERTATVRETGGVSVDVDGAISISDVYKEALKKDFKAFLVSDREYTDEAWEFSLLPEEDEDDIA